MFTGERTSEAAELSALKDLTAAPSIDFPDGGQVVVTREVTKESMAPDHWKIF